MTHRFPVPMFKRQWLPRITGLRSEIRRGERLLLAKLAEGRVLVAVPEPGRPLVENGGVNSRARFLLARESTPIAFFVDRFRRGESFDRDSIERVSGARLLRFWHYAWIEARASSDPELPPLRFEITDAGRRMLTLTAPYSGRER